MIWLRKNLYAILLAAKALLLALTYAKGRRDATAKRDTQDLEDYHDTRKRIDQVVRDHDGADSAEWLHERGKRK
jgi:hypothetical protein